MTGLSSAAGWVFRWIANVSSRTALLVTDGGFDGNKAADAATVETRLVHPDEFVVLLDQLQPAASKSAVVTRKPGRGVGTGRAAEPTPLVAERRGRSRAHTWARLRPSRGLGARQRLRGGARARLHAEVIEAYRHAQNEGSSH